MRKPAFVRGNAVPVPLLVRRKKMRLQCYRGKCMSGADLLSSTRSIAKTAQYGRAAASAAERLPPPHAHTYSLKIQH